MTTFSDDLVSELVLQETRSSEKVVTRVSGHSVPGAEYAPQIRCNLTAESLYFKKQDRQRRLSLVFRDILFRVRNMLLKIRCNWTAESLYFKKQDRQRRLSLVFRDILFRVRNMLLKYAVIGPPLKYKLSAVQLQRILRSIFRTRNRMSRNTSDNLL